MSSKFSTNVEGKIHEIRLDAKKGYQALFEVISNSIYSINNSNQSDGRIDIQIERDPIFQAQIGVSLEQQKAQQKVNNIIVTDNGDGFTLENFNSFLTCYSDLKQNKGGKGVGRFTCLKVFDFEEVSSVYEENGKLYKRSFIFEPKNELKNEQNVETTDKKLTTIKLTSIKTKYKFDFPTDLKILADLIIEHFFIDFITGKIPNIYIHDECNGSLWINKYYKEEAEYEVEKTSFEILDKNFDIYHIKASNINKSNKLYLCADNRKVSHIDLRKHIPNLQSNISNDDGKKKWYFAYLTSEYLNEMVNSERTEFNFPDEDKTEMGFIDISLDTLTKKTIDIISSFLEKDLQIIEKEKRDRIDKYIFTKAPKYRQLKKYCPNFYFNIPNDAKDDKLEMALYSTQRDWEKEIKKKGLQLSNKAKKYNADEIEALKEEYLQGVSAIGKASLTDYICKRKAILDILDNSLSANPETQKYSLEEVVHKLICPMIATSDDLEYEDMNLWIIDEKLAYHYYLASDKTLKSQEPIESNSTKETDLAIYHAGLTFNNTPKTMPYQALTIVEFKRPMRDDYNNSDNPIQQVLDYISLIREGKAKDKNGRLISGQLENLPIYVYIIADITPTLKKICIDNNFTTTPDNEGYFTYHSNRKAYIEIISYKKLLENAQQRNKMLFDKLFEK